MSSFENQSDRPTYNDLMARYAREDAERLQRRNRLTRFGAAGVALVGVLAAAFLAPKALPEPAPPAEQAATLLPHTRYGENWLTESDEQIIVDRFRDVEKFWKDAAGPDSARLVVLGGGAHTLTCTTLFSLKTVQASTPESSFCPTTDEIIVTAANFNSWAGGDPGTPGRDPEMAADVILSHEYGHYLQHNSDRWFSLMDPVTDQIATQRQFEAQATCAAGVYTAATNPAAIPSLARQFGNMEEGMAHDSAQQKASFMLGALGGPEACDVRNLPS